MYGVEPGHSVTASGHAALTATIVTPATQQLADADGQAAAARPAGTPRPAPGTIIQPSSILVMNARPTTAPAQASVRVRPGLDRAHDQVRGEDEQEHEQRVRVVDAPDGDRHRRDGQRAGGQQGRAGAEHPLDRRVQQPDRGDGADRLGQQHRERREPEHARPESPISQNASGGLSTVMNEPGSIDPKNSAFHDTVADFTAAA